MPLFSYRSAWATALNSDVKLKLDAKISGKSVLPRRQGLLLPSRLPQGARVRRRLIRDRHDHRLARETRGCCHRRDGKRHAKSKVVETSGLLCVATASGQAKFALWLLTPDRQWERRCEFWTLGSQKKLRCIYHAADKRSDVTSWEFTVRSLSYILALNLLF
jgi:hypothetical protein